MAQGSVAFGAGPRFRGTLVQLVGGWPTVVSRGGVPVAPVPLLVAASVRPTVRRAGRGSLRGQVRVPARFDDPHPRIAAVFGVA
ncbi:prevent-host-death protein [Streptomyces microflavus]|uniref:prevent-host-death protein n=1 Tax=Streptomyces microflavus TaxID=1919 RepID=UPI00343AFD7F